MRARRTPVVALLLLCLVACGGSAVKRHSYAAQTLDDLALASKEAVLTEREAVLLVAGKNALEQGQNAEDAIAAAAKAYQPKIDAVNGFIAAKDLYVRAVLAAIAKDVDMSTAKPMLQKALIAYEGVRVAFPAAPELPSAIKELLK